MIGPAAGGFLVSDFRTCACLSGAIQLVVTFLALHTFPTPPAASATAAAALENLAASAGSPKGLKGDGGPSAAAIAAGDDSWTEKPFTAPSRPDEKAKAGATSPSKSKKTNKSAMPGFLSFLSTGVLRTRGALFLLALRFGLAIAYHIFNTAFQASLRTRFDFTPKLYSTYLVRFVRLKMFLSHGAYIFAHALSLNVLSIYLDVHSAFFMPPSLLSSDVCRRHLRAFSSSSSQASDGLL